MSHQTIFFLFYFVLLCLPSHISPVSCPCVFKSMCSLRSLPLSCVKVCLGSSVCCVSCLFVLLGFASVFALCSFAWMLISVGFKLIVFQETNNLNEFCFTNLSLSVLCFENPFFLVFLEQALPFSFSFVVTNPTKWALCQNQHKPYFYILCKSEYINLNISKKQKRCLSSQSVGNSGKMQVVIQLQITATVVVKSFSLIFWSNAPLNT